MKGAIIGDIIGSAYINSYISNSDIQLLTPTSSFTDDTILTLSTADALMNNTDFSTTLKKWVRKFPMAGYNQKFLDWALSEKDIPYLSRGNGSARRISPIGFAADSIEEARKLAANTSKITHNYPVKIAAAEAIAASIFILNNGGSKAELKRFLINEFNYKLNKSATDYAYDVRNLTIETSPVPAAINAFLLSNNFEDAIRRAILLGGPSNTIGSITGALAQAFYKHIPKSIVRKSLSRLNSEMLALVLQFENSFDLHLHTELAISKY